MTSPSSPNSGSALPAPRPTSEARERVVELLSRHFAADGITLDDFELRVERAYSVATAAELAALVADVPSSAPTQSGSALGPADAAAVPAPVEDRLVAVLSNHERHGRWAVPRRLKVVAVLGNAELDLTEATFTPGLTEIHISAFLANVEITVPAHVRVEGAGSALLGSFNAGGGNAMTGEAECVLRITGRAVLSSVETRAAWHEQLGSGD